MPPSLFTELRLCDAIFKNRVVVSPMAQYSARCGLVQPWHIQHLGALAAGSPGLLIIEATSVEPKGYGYNNCLALHNDDQQAAFEELIRNIRSYSDTPLGLQINHNGRKGSSFDPSHGGGPMLPEHGGWDIYAPSAISFGDAWPTPLEMTYDDIQSTIASFIASASRAAKLDIDVLELHSAHGYLLHSFLSPISNHRDDDYGGSFERRLRFVREIVSGVRAVWPLGRPLGIRLNSQDWQCGGLSLDDTVLIAAELREVGVNYVCISAGAISSKVRVVATPGYLVPHASYLRRKTGICTVVTGMIIEPAMANEIIRDGYADMVALARVFLDDPRWVWRAAEALRVEIDYPYQYSRIKPAAWSGAKLARQIRSV